MANLRRNDERRGGNSQHRGRYNNYQQRATREDRAGEIETDGFLRVSAGIVGTCQDVEKRYIRVQSQPHPSTIRPERVLKLSLEAVKKREADGEEYEVCHEYYMSICQDLRIQQLEGGFTVEVRENFARCAMRARIGDKKRLDTKTLGDCLIHLQELYEKNANSGHEVEFGIYRLVLWLGLSLEHEDSLLVVHACMASLSQFEQHPAVKHALEIVSAVLTGDVVSYFKLVAAIPDEVKDQRHVHETLITPSMRSRYYSAMLKAYKFGFPLVELRGLLGCSSKEELTGFLRSQQAVLDEEQGVLDIDKSKR
ncbi:hypothetical protein GUITHDRAFT_118206 [Guillardia theta CCMP2712]|uniref:SAC3/GANP/THP3 conserved domain-containing protein n=1 Tax=Guillardia theta (strain CCMP2712) TaxID=905079 RepID=L1IH72_GUITC|nr:hypothetical protein GUITHDRAFT_118206 [Guillardia theta CCMP2712]EKX35606.1 hypothetical protein GUITHDRAFT_118206 [Guillardia theta CCMP2712]|eukprot:XP_005822586.1 hypothetical protein GUITHDRAFT_118206 [Guillardia theta CCMP2712]